MSSTDVFSKLSRILETHNFTTDDKAIDRIVSEYINAESFGEKGHNARSLSLSGQNMGLISTSGKNSATTSPQRDRRSHEEISHEFPNGVRPTPYEVWKVKNYKPDTMKEPVKLSEYEWDKLADKMSSSNRVRQSAMIRQQNNGLAMELGGHEFKPKLNKTSLELASTMKPLRNRVDDMLKEREKFLTKRREDLVKEEMAECSFVPNRLSAKTTEKYLKRIGRSKVTPDDLIRYREEKKVRNEKRKEIIDEVESRELTFKPRINLRSQKIEAKMQDNQEIVIDPLTRTRSYRSKKSTDDAMNVVEGPVLILESDHPYRHNVNEYSAVNIPNAISYTITFDEQTSTEPIHDFIRFYRDDCHEEYYGATKYSGGYNGSPGNWPGTGGRPPLCIHASKFVVHFKSNGALNDWGFRMQVVPLIKFSTDDESDISSIKSGKPQISYLGKTYGKKNDNTLEGGNKTPVHDRLYQKGMEKIISNKELMSEIIQQKLKLPLKHWEENKTFLDRSYQRSTASIFEEEINISDSSKHQVTIVEYDDNVAFLWKSLKNAALFSG